MKSAQWLIESVEGLFRALGTMIAWMVMGAFITVTAVSILWKLDHPPIPGLHGAAASLPSSFYTDMVKLELAELPERDEPYSFSSKNVTRFLTRLTTGIDPDDPRTLAAQLLPGAPMEENVILIQGIGTGPGDYPVEVPPAPHLTTNPPIVGKPEEEVPPQETSEPAPGETDTPETDLGLGETRGADSGNDPLPEEETKPVFFVYHSHPEESFLPELDGVKEISEAYEKTDKSRTITSVGKRLADKLAQRGVGAIHSDESYPWNTAYLESRKTVKAAMQQHQGLQYFIDIHRDSARKAKTVLTENGTTYARVFFVVGRKNPDYELNQAFANELHYRMEQKVRGISRGVVGKKEGSNGEFNQSLSPNSILVEIGGVDNTLEEAFRTAELLADVLAELYWDRSEAVKAGGTPAAQ